MNAVELEAYKLEQSVTSNIQNAETSMDVIETYYGYIKNKEIVINSVNSNIDSLYQLVSDTYKRVLDTNTPLTSLDGFNPKFAVMIAFSISLIIDLSNG